MNPMLRSRPANWSFMFLSSWGGGGGGGGGGRGLGIHRGGVFWLQLRFVV